MTIHSVFTWNILIFIRLGTWEWVDGAGWVWMTCAINSTHHQSWCLGVRAGCWGPVFCSRKVVYCYLKYIHGGFIFKYVSGRTYFVESFDFPKGRLL
jgi:hypothetical protein